MTKTKRKMRNQMKKVFRQAQQAKRKHQRMIKAYHKLQRRYKAA
jgi:hypothetical protein